MLQGDYISRNGSIRAFYAYGDTLLTLLFTLRETSAADIVVAI